MTPPGVLVRRVLGSFWPLWVLLAAPAALAQQAVVRSYDAPELEVGQAWLTRSGDRCLAVMPLHVARETTVPSLLREGDRGLRGEALELVDLGDDAALAVVNGSITQACGFTLGSISRSVAHQLRDGGLGALRTVNGDGTLGRLAVTVIDDDGERFLRVLPTSQDQRIRKGLSGSLLLLNDQPVGMLLSVHARSGVGTVMRTDVLLDKVERHLRGDAAVAAAAAPGPVDEPAVADSPAAAGPWRVVAWNVDPIAVKQTPARLVAADTAGHWAARVEAWPAALELAGPEQIRLVHGVAFVAGGADPAALPERVQVLTSVGGDRPAWRVAGSAALVFADGVATVTFPAARARLVRIEIFGSRSLTDRVALSRLQVLDAAR